MGRTSNQLTLSCLISIFSLVGCTAPKAALSNASNKSNSGSTTTGGTTGGTTGSTTGTSGNVSDYFPPDSVWNRDISSTALDSESSQVIQWLDTAGGFGTGRFQVDFSITVLKANASTPNAPFTKTSSYYEPDCDNLTTFPLPTGGAIEGENGYTCTSGGDCHLLVLDQANKKLYEAYGASVVGGAVTSQCGVVWDLNRIYPSNGRGEQCTSTDAAGFPVAPLLFTADEIAAGAINHAIRFILPNNRMRLHTYVHPASHAGAPSATGMAPIYGMRFRLKSSFNLNALKPSAQVVARALQKYGMLLADGGNIALTAASDRFTTHKWSEVDFTASDLNAIHATDFEVVDGGQRITLTYDCVRNP